MLINREENFGERLEEKGNVGIGQKAEADLNNPLLFCCTCICCFKKLRFSTGTNLATFPPSKNPGS